MPMKERFKNAWNAFVGRDPLNYRPLTGPTSYSRPDSVPISYNTTQSGLEAMYNRIAVDVSIKPIRHIRVDEEDRYIETIKDSLNDCFSFSTNLDQTPRDFMQSAVLTMLDTGSVAIVPTLAESDPATGWTEIYELRAGKITEWSAKHVRVSLYNPQKARYIEYVFSKSEVAIVYNPFYNVMNGANSIGKRLAQKLALLDSLDNQAGSPRLDMIFQLPYAIKGEARKKQAMDRRKEIEDQLVNSKYGLAYVDATEKFTQLNRPVENNMMARVEYYSSMLQSQVGFKTSILDGSATEDEKVNYDNSIVCVILKAFVDEMKRKFLSQTARTKGEDITYFKQPLDNMNPSKFIELAERLVMIEAVTSNEVRQVLGMKPSTDPGADELRNKHLSVSDAEIDQQQAEPYDEGGQ